MHKLDRNSVTCPECLMPPLIARRYKELDSAEKKEIRERLLELQMDRCAYCERRTGRGRDEGHIEHFRKQAGHNHLELDWENLFWSCLDESTCGKHKDKCDRPAGTGRQAKFDPSDLIDPSRDDPDEFLQFIVDGTVRLKDDLSSTQAHRAKETLRVFQIDSSPLLRKSREDAIRPYVGAIDSLLPFGIGVVTKYVQSENAKIESAPFSTAIKHYLGGLLS